MSTKQIFRIIFNSKGEEFEVYARQIYQSELWGFIEIEDLVFDDKSQLVVNPSEEKLKNTFENVKRSYIPLTAIIRIDEVIKEGIGKIVAIKEGNVKTFPVPPSPLNV